MEDEQKLTEQQRTALSQLEDLRSELHSMVDARVDGSIHSILTGRVLEQALPTLPLTANPSVFKGEKPESILFPDGREVKTPTWKTAVLAIMRDCNADAKMHLQLMELRGKVLGRQRAILAASPEKMHAPLEIDKDLYMESYYDTGTLLYVLKNRVLDEVGYNYFGIHVRLRQEQTQEEIFRYYFLRQPQRVIGVHIGRTRSTAGRHIQLALQRLRKEMEVSRYE